MAAGRALSEMAGATDLLSDPLSRDVHRSVASAVAQAAVKSGVAKRVLDEDYFSGTGNAAR